MSEMEDTIADGFKGRRQLPYAHWITFLMLKAVQVRTPEMVVEYRGATTEFPAYNMVQQDQARQAQETAANFTQFQAR